MAVLHKNLDTWRWCGGDYRIGEKRVHAKKYPREPFFFFLCHNSKKGRVTHSGGSKGVLRFIISRGVQWAGSIVP